MCCRSDRETAPAKLPARLTWPGDSFNCFPALNGRWPPVNGVVPGFEENLGQRATLASLRGHLLGNVLAIGNPFRKRSVFTVVR